LRDVCETDPADPDLNDTVCIGISDLKIIVERHISHGIETISNILAVEIECGVFEQHVVPALATARKVLTEKVESEL
jgi:hypothetical protein